MILGLGVDMVRKLLPKRGDTKRGGTPLALAAVSAVAMLLLNPSFG